MAKLLPCPFCGGEVDHYHTEHISLKQRKHRFRCNKCKGLFFFWVNGDYENKEQVENEAIKFWNTRTQKEREVSEK